MTRPTLSGVDLSRTQAQPPLVPRIAASQARPAPLVCARRASSSAAWCRGTHAAAQRSGAAPRRRDPRHYWSALGAHSVARHGSAQAPLCCSMCGVLLNSNLGAAIRLPVGSQGNWCMQCGCVPDPLGCSSSPKLDCPRCSSGQHRCEEKEVPRRDEVDIKPATAAQILLSRISRASPRTGRGLRPDGAFRGWTGLHSSGRGMSHAIRS
jgi:hypothetical protein